MGHNTVNLAALIGSRICHDLISPIGAINNGLELLGMTGAAASEGPELDLITESVDNASARIRFFRVAYGASSDQEIGRSEIVSVLNDVMRSSRLKVAWGPLDAQPRSMVRLAFLAIQCAETAMPYGGRLEVTCTDGKWMIHGKADKLNIDTALWRILDGADAEDSLAPAHVQFALLPAVAQDENRTPATSIGDQDIKISF